MTMGAQNLAGILNINKPAGMTSHDVVKQVRGLIKARKVGHAGTLDPLATGVLLVCVGQATRLIEYLMAGEKVYRAAILFGQTTTTYDAEGDVVAVADPSHLTVAAVQRAFSGFTGQIEQVPPPFSAIKKQGIPLYRLARSGQIVKPEPRPVQIEAIEPLAWRLPEVIVKVTCQSGTYIRSLAHDVGQKLGVGAHLTSLVRLRSGDWRLEEAISLATLKEVVLDHRLDTVLHAKEKALTALPRIDLSAEQARSIRFGQSITVTAPPKAAVLAGYDAGGRLVAIMRVVGPQQLAPHKVFKEEP